MTPASDSRPADHAAAVTSAGPALLSYRDLAAIAGAVIVVLLAMVGLRSYQLHAADDDLRRLQALTAEQQSKLRTIDRQTDDLSNQLRAVQRENAEIKRLIGRDHGRRSHATTMSQRHARLDDFAAVQHRLARLAHESAATRYDAEVLRHLAMRVLNLRRMASIARERSIAAIPSLNPVGGAIASGFGWRTDPWPEFHKGLDLEANYGTPVHASATGTVASAGWDAGFGIKIDIDHGNGYHTWYAHLSRVTVAPGEHVAKGQAIALSGSTGESTGPHLHYQVMFDGQPVDPQPFLQGVPPKVLATLPDAQGV